MVIPAQAGMIPIVNVFPRLRAGYPCTSGDDPEYLNDAETLEKLSLHKRGWSWNCEKRYQGHTVIPAQAGMILRIAMINLFINGYPCTSGDDPEQLENYENLIAVSLHKRGWSRVSKRGRHARTVIPAQAGMIPCKAVTGLHVSGYPCTSGDDPICIVFYWHNL